MIERDQETGRFKIVRPRDLIEKHKEKEAKSNRHRIDENQLKWTPLGPEIINEEQLSDADDEEDEQLAKVIEESKQNMETPKITEKKKRKRKKGMKGHSSSFNYYFIAPIHLCLFEFIEIETPSFPYFDKCYRKILHKIKNKIQVTTIGQQERREK